ncbi:uncharacterized protein LOC110464825 [Mizuhopecten yessoensis]|uniref:EF-hand domain-containing protein n=1 Tax=Mizuhopecten yessoensis TaxID=6573 RepID=A0A210PT09_MIZYE|nr:uncharacterized protein LOC110464825 [Mizuhopecten yessoensis]OWF39602.1 hypothetical protein KP79_PYT22179 [Mizuhopecten yessoensis]
MTCIIKIVFPCLLLMALCSSLPVKRDESAKNMLKQRRNGVETTRDHSIQLIVTGIKPMDNDSDNHIDRHELENIFRYVNINLDEDSAQYLAEEVFSSKEFEHNDGDLPIHDLATFFNDINDMGIF